MMMPYLKCDFLNFNCLFADNLDDDFPVSAPVVKVDKDNLLPRSQSRPAAGQRNRQGRFHEGGAYVREPVAVSPSLIVRIRDV